MILFSTQYLGVILNLADWQSPESRTEFLQLVDQAQVRRTSHHHAHILFIHAFIQMKGEIMWSSLTPKLLHISPRWLVISDQQRKVANPSSGYCRTT